MITFNQLFEFCEQNANSKKILQSVFRAAICQGNLADTFRDPEISPCIFRWEDFGIIGPLSKDPAQARKRIQRHKNHR